MPHIEDPTVLEKLGTQVNTLTEFSKSGLELMKDRIVISMLYNMIDHCAKGRDALVAQIMVNHVLHRKRTNGEFKFNAQIGEYDVDSVILDLGSDVNVLPKQTWEMMVETELIWSLVQLRAWITLRMKIYIKI